MDAAPPAVVCALCQKLRVADDEWVEQEPPPDQAVAHGLCPDCRARAWPDLSYGP